MKLGSCGSSGRSENGFRLLIFECLAEKSVEAAWQGFGADTPALLMDRLGWVGLAEWSEVFAKARNDDDTLLESPARHLSF